ncbi:MAG: leucine--tRNA ligase, partial [Chloroflexota bacterium]|nr:leucine--tRNA ligase [Chloroflexota bacterium]
MSEKYNPSEIERKWQSKWQQDRLYATTEADDRPKHYELTMFPYTSGDLHIGHWFAMAPADVHARFMRMKGYNVLHPIGFDAFGLPAENAAIKRGIHPFKWTMDNVENMRRQLRTIGAIYDWDREVITCLPEYYKWTQWLFLKFYEAGLAYRANATANWCPHCQTVLANEQVIGEGQCERCDTPVIRKDMEQWFFRITKYADELMQHEGLDWPERVKTMQHNWVGRSEGAEISFDISEYGLDEKEIRVFTTRPDTVFGVTFMVLAPEHPLVGKLTTPEQKQEVEDYVNWTRHQSEIERLSTEKEKTGVFIGAYATNKLNGERIPIWITDYVLFTYGTGAVMAVPAHDQRDFEMAQKFGLDIKVVISPKEWTGETFTEAYEEPGTMTNSSQFDGLFGGEGKKAVIAFLEENWIGKGTISYRLRDWLISRQRYWGAPIPMVYCSECGIVPVSEKDLPVLLPEDAEFKPTGESPLKYC